MICTLFFYICNVLTLFKQLFIKKTYLTLIVLFLGTFVYSNNWQPIQNGKTYHYKLDTATAITHSIRVDSVEIIGSDSVFCLNQIMTKCDTCPNGNYFGIALRNQPQFLMRKMTKISDNQYLFSDTATFEIRPHSALNDVWVFNSELGINATMYFSGVTQVFWRNRLGLIHWPFERKNHKNLEKPRNTGVSRAE